jgi:hypothetical protein
MLRGYLTGYHGEKKEGKLAKYSNESHTYICERDA